MTFIPVTGLNAVDALRSSTTESAFGPSLSKPYSQTSLFTSIKSVLNSSLLPFEPTRIALSDPMAAKISPPPEVDPMTSPKLYSETDASSVFSTSSII